MCPVIFQTLAYAKLKNLRQGNQKIPWIILFSLKHGHFYLFFCFEFGLQRKKNSKSHRMIIKNHIWNDISAKITIQKKWLGIFTTVATLKNSVNMCVCVCVCVWGESPGWTATCAQYIWRPMIDVFFNNAQLENE